MRTWMRSSRWLVVLAALCLSLSMACGDDDDSEGGNAGGGQGGDDDTNSVTVVDGQSRGHTECGSSECQPGTFCANAAVEVCEPGCVSDLNCLETHQCEDVSSVTGTGVCERVDSGGSSGGGDDALVEDCREYFCDRAGEECGFLDAGGQADCRQLCQDEVEEFPQEVEALVDCSQLTAGSCSDFDDQCLGGMGSGEPNSTDEPPNTGGGNNGGDDQGFTSCGNFNTCQPGQYCEDDTFGDCAPGCLSNANCASDQTCESESGEPIGTCENI